MKIKEEKQILDEDFRKKVLTEIVGQENKDRKRNSEDRYNIFKDRTKRYVLKRFQDEQGIESAREVQFRLSNISFCKKMIQKKSRVYDHGVERIVLDNNEASREVKQKQVDQLVKIMKMDTNMKKANDYSELQKNCTVKVLPFMNPATGKWRYKLSALNPHFYDVLESAENPEVPLVHIFSYFHDDNGGDSSSLVNGIRGNEGVNFRYGDNVDQYIADSPSDDFVDNVRYIWWAPSYHLTTNSKGEIIPDATPDNMLNPIGMSTFVDFSIDQDNHYWAIGGDDIVDASILLNMLLTDLYYISRYQGLGIFYFFGRGVPKSIKIGPKEVLTLDIREGDPTPQIGFANSSAPLDVHMRMIEQQLAFTMSTNNIEASSIKGSLDAAQAQSGIQEIIQKSENVGDIEAAQQLYKDGEPHLFKIMAKWHNLYLSKNLLDDDLASLGKLDENMEIAINFNKPQVMLSDKERLDIYKQRKELNIDSEIDLIMKDNPMMSREDAELKFKKVLEDKLIQSSMALKEMVRNDQKGNIQLRDPDEKSEDQGQIEAQEGDR